MGIFSSIGGIFGPIGGVIGGVADGLLARDDAREANSANAANARTMRQTAYQDTVQDLQAAGLNPMLAYSNGPTSGNMPPMQNKGLQAAQQVSATSAADLAQAQKAKTDAETDNAKAQTALIQAQTAKTTAEVGLVGNTTTNVAAQTEQIKQNIDNLKAELARVTMDKDLKYQQGLSEVTRRNLMEAQQELANIQFKLARAQISNTEAQTETQKVLTTLRGLEIPGAKNLADFERMMDTGAGNAPKAIGGLANSVGAVIQLLRSLQK